MLTTLEENKAVRCNVLGMTDNERQEYTILLSRMYHEIGNEGSSQKLLDCCPDRVCHVRGCISCDARQARRERAKSLTAHECILEHSPAATLHFASATVRDVPLAEMGTAVTQIKSATSALLRTCKTLGTVQSTHLKPSEVSDGFLHLHCHTNIWSDGEIDSSEPWNDRWSAAVNRTAPKLIPQSIRIEESASAHATIRYLYPLDPFSKLLGDEQTARIVLPQLRHKQLSFRGGMAALRPAQKKVA